MIIFGQGDFLGVQERKYTDKETGEEKVIRTLVILDDDDTLKFYCNDDLMDSLESQGIKRMDPVKLKFQLDSKITVVNGFGREVVNTSLLSVLKFEQQGKK